MKPLLLLLLFMFSTWFLLSSPLELLTGVPSHITREALEQPNFWSLLLSGTAEERHRFAHGQWTKYGTLNFDTDTYLQSHGWTEEQIHNVGYKLGFSKLRER